MVTCGAPVYHNDEFMGTINLDLTLDFLNSFVTNFEPGYGTVFLINDHNQLIAHPEIVVSADNKVNSARTAFPEAIQDDLAQLFSHRPMQPVEQDSYVFFYQNLHNAPWKLVFVAPESELTLSLLSKMGLGFVVLILGLVIITIITISATRREFITPAELLVKHIRDESNNQATAVPEVPKPWIPWFETISGIFQSNRQLMTELREHNEQLDALVEQRTRELKVKNTELEQSLEQIRSMQEQIITQEKLASLGALTAGIAHEIKNPLNFVNNFAELSVDLVKELREELGSHQDLFDQETQDYIEEILQDLEQNSSKINEHGKRADSIVRGMLLHARGKSGDFQPVDINALMDEYAKLAYHGLRAQDSNFNIDLKTSYDQSIGPVELVPQDISRVFLNIVNNACYATNEKKKTAGDDYHPQVSVVTRNLGDKVEIRIRDNGTGMPPEVVKKIFQPFFTTKPTGQGTGLGLSISFDILNSHQGEMRVETEDGQYTEFIVTLPKKQA
jgi:signal transduction histidine kinase